MASQTLRPRPPVAHGLVPPGSASSRRRRPPVASPKDEEATVRSLQIKNDERYIAMNHYTEQMSGSKNDSHYSRLVRKNRELVGRRTGSQVLDDCSTWQEVSDWSLNTEVDFGERFRKQPVAHIADRIDWQESFDHRVRRLLLDFQLSDVPSCRLQHLDRMHAWFQEHGAKQTRKAQQGPSYLKVDRNTSVPAGSTRGLDLAKSTTTEILSTAFKRT
mmetsp:Transcript_51368/g.119394  ORF Transcript_51368/g.119394 Transcript_51368/m.119394 type:complete len:217 (-) Transcript_51368:188-838(-)